MQVTVDIPDHIARTLPTGGESVEESIVRAATVMAVRQEAESSRDTAVTTGGGFVPNPPLRAPGSAFEQPCELSVEERRSVIEQMLADAKGRFLGQSIRSAIDEGRRY